MITVVAGGSNRGRDRLWKLEIRMWINPSPLRVSDFGFSPAIERGKSLMPPPPHPGPISASRS